MPTPSAPSAVLVVDDDHGVCDVMAMIVEGAGYDAVKARNGEEAVALVRDRGSDFALVVLDMTMRGLDGPHTWLAIHALQTELPFVLVSGDQGDTVRQALTAHDIRPDDPTIRSFVKKPFMPCDLQDAVREALGD